MLLMSLQKKQGDDGEEVDPKAMFEKQEEEPNEPTVVDIMEDLEPSNIIAGLRQHPSRRKSMKNQGLNLEDYLISKRIQKDLIEKNE
mmetsp:Transcript_20047/g.30818  ORF Transcript_20047/g.30818 Transcript_20047/m.30818 type:complete len:87 (+) Transcript_20047:103-363(+)